MALNEFVQTALDEEGYEEGSDGYTKYGFMVWFSKCGLVCHVYFLVCKPSWNHDHIFYGNCS